MKKYGLHGKLTAKSGHRDELAEILMEAAKIVSEVKGCIIYFVSTDPEDEHSLWITEVWRSKADHDNSLANERVQVLIAKAIPLLDGNPEKGRELTVLGGAGIN